MLACGIPQLNERQDCLLASAASGSEIVARCELHGTSNSRGLPTVGVLDESAKYVARVDSPRGVRKIGLVEAARASPLQYRTLQNPDHQSTGTTCQSSQKLVFKCSVRRVYFEGVGVGGSSKCQRLGAVHPLSRVQKDLCSLVGMDHGKGGAAVQVHVVKAEGIDASSRSMYVEVTQHDEASSAPPSGVLRRQTNSSSLPFYIGKTTGGARAGSKQCTLRLSSSRMPMPSRFLLTPKHPPCP